jgi:hypothetical protein
VFQCNTLWWKTDITPLDIGYALRTISCFLRMSVFAPSSEPAGFHSHYTTIHWIEWFSFPLQYHSLNWMVFIPVTLPFIELNGFHSRKPVGSDDVFAQSSGLIFHTDLWALYYLFISNISTKQTLPIYWLVILIVIATFSKFTNGNKTAAILTCYIIFFMGLLVNIRMIENLLKS